MQFLMIQIKQGRLPMDYELPMTVLYPGIVMFGDLLPWGGRT
ncbi:MAG: hypothetical protein RIR97_1851 [Pseudomonadota bacterium]|jgi:hypothetical protein